jgi:PIN domain nuclease of toxin-antitoxin system
LRLLLDTHLLVWAALRPEKLSPAAVELMEDPENRLLFSPVSIIEVVIKSSLNQPNFQIDPMTFRTTMLNVGYGELELTSEHALGVQRLPNLHNDPFDKMLIAQAIVEQVSLVTADKIVAAYPGPIICV